METPTPALPGLSAPGTAVGPDPGGARWAYLAGATGTFANALLVGFFALMPVAGRENPLGPANDLVGSVATACMIPAAVAIGRHLPRRGRLRGLQVATLGGLGVATAAGPLLVAGVLPFPVSTAASTCAYGVLVAWIGITSSWLARHEGLPRFAARVGQATAWASLVGVGAAAAGYQAAPEPVRGALLAVGLTAGAAAWLAVPGWWVLVGRWLRG